MFRINVSVKMNNELKLLQVINMDYWARGLMSTTKLGT